MKIEELLLIEASEYVKKLKNMAKAHYPDTESEDEAVIQLLARSVNHAEEDDNRQDMEIDQLENTGAREFTELTTRLAQVEEIIKQLQHNSLTR